MLDCRRKEKMMIKRFGGDLVLKFIDLETNKVVYEIWFEMKGHKKENYSKLKSHFLQIKKLLARQEDSIGIEDENNS